MKRFSAVLFISTFIAFSITAFDNDTLSVRITPRVDFVSGIINEYVFNEKNLHTDHKESQLDWDLTVIPVLGITGDFTLFRHVYIGFDGSAGIPIRSGHMQDYDWLNSVVDETEYPSWHLDDPNQLTNYSIHDNYLEKYITFSASLGYNIFLPAEIKLTPLIAYQYEFIAFTGKDGYSIYKWNNWQKESFSGKVISYKQELNSMLLGLSLKVSTIPHIFLAADCLVSPKMTFLNALDYHYNPRLFHPYGVAFWDKLTNIFQLQSKLLIQYKFNNIPRAGLSGAIQYIPLSKGDTRIKSLTSEGTPEKGLWGSPYINGGGTSRLIWNISLNYSFSL